MNQITPLNARNIADSIFEGLAISDDPMFNDEDWDPILRVKIKLNLKTPLPKGFYNRRPGKEEWISFMYERLPSFCSWCGMLDHQTSCYRIIKTQEAQDNVAIAYQIYGPWIRALPRRNPVGNAKGPWTRITNSVHQSPIPAITESQ